MGEGSKVALPNTDFFQHASVEDIMFYLMPEKNRANEAFYDYAYRIIIAVISCLVHMRNEKAVLTPMVATSFRRLGHVVSLYHIESLPAPLRENLLKAMQDLPGFCLDAFDKSGKLIPEHRLANAALTADHQYSYLHQLYMWDINKVLLGAHVPTAN